MLTAKIDRAFVRFQQHLATNGPKTAFEALVSELHNIRLTAPAQEWRDAVIALRRHPVQARLLEDPFAAEAFRKTRGYAGDASTLDYVYRYRNAIESTPLGKDLFALTTNSSIAGAVRTRCEHIAEAIRITVENKPSPVILSVACGHMRELHQLAPASLAHASFFGIDQDPQTTDCLAKLHPNVSLLPINARISEIIAGRTKFPDVDLIYSAGLYDYLEGRIARALTTSLVKRLRPGGAVMLSNLTPDSTEIAYMEAVGDWWMIYRDENQLAEICNAAITNGNTRLSETYTIASGRVACATIRTSPVRSLQSHHESWGRASAVSA